VDIPRPNASQRRSKRIFIAFVFGVIVLAFVVVLACLKPMPTQMKSSQVETKDVTVNKEFGFKVTKTGTIDGYFSYVIENSAGEKYLAFGDYVVPLTK
jgi:hypothetical protein